jgi:2-polyprenyl-6-methoxyphenol hydroxylase-like FAD-dependent oxidoreductase
MSQEILIAGAGPTGLTMAIELRRFGLPVRLIDKAERATQWSQALVVQARTLEQFARYGIAEQAVERGRKITEVHFWSDNKLLATFHLEHIPSRFPYALLLPQNETEQILTGHLRALGVEVERQTELIDFENDLDRSGVTAELRHADGRTERTRFRWLLGCDGAHSTVRRKMGVSFEGNTVGMRFALGDLKLVGEDVPGDELEIHLHRGGDVLFIAKLKEDVHRVIVALHERQKGEEKMPEIADFNDAFARFELQIKAESATWRAPFHINERKAGQYRQRSVFLAGDASHIHSPVGGQGMNTGIQDAANLAWKLAAVTRGAPERLLDSYNEERGAVGEALLRGTSRGLRAATAANPIVEKLRDFVLHEATQLETIQNSIAEGISEISIQYRESSVVVEDAHGGGAEGGDRMPDAERKGTGERLLDGLRGGEHLIVALNVPPGEVPREFSGTSLLEIDSRAGEWIPPIEELLGKGPKIYVVRPDGYIGFRGSKYNETLNVYARDMGLMRVSQPLAAADAAGTG